MVLLTQIFRRCGVCGACHRRGASPHTRNVSVAVHALELLDDNRNIIRWAVNSTGLGDVATVHALAASNVTSDLQFLIGHGEHLSGKESTSACTSAAHCRAGKGSALRSVHAVSLDDLMHTLGLSQLYHVSIDVEGWDALVVEGMRDALARRAVELFEFEHKRSGYWTHNDVTERRTLGHLVAWVGAAGYRCYLQTATKLMDVSGECWSAQYDQLGWSNLLCAHRPSVLALLDTKFGTSVQQILNASRKG